MMHFEAFSWLSFVSRSDFDICKIDPPNLFSLPHSKHSRQDIKGSPLNGSTFTWPEKWESLDLARNKPVIKPVLGNTKCADRGIRPKKQKKYALFQVPCKTTQSRDTNKTALSLSFQAVFQLEGSLFVRVSGLA